MLYFLILSFPKVQRNSLQNRLWIIKHFSVLEADHAYAVFLNRGSTFIIVFAASWIVVDGPV